MYEGLTPLDYWPVLIVCNKLKLITEKGILLLYFCYFVKFKITKDILTSKNLTNDQRNKPLDSQDDETYM